MEGTSVLKLKVDDKEYNASLKQAQQGMQHLEQALKGADKSFQQVDKSVVDYVRGIGQMEAQCKTARGRINEMSSAFIELSLQYKNMSDEVKSSDVGKALSGSLDQLKTRIGDAKKELNDVGRELGDVGNVSNETGGILESLAGKFGMNIKQLASWDTAIAAAKGALEVAKDAFFASEQNLDDWNRAVYASKSTYEAFLTSINTGDISGFLTRIDDIVKAATEAYNAMDALSTQKAINNSAVQAQQAENQRFRMMLMTRRWISAADGRSSGGMKDGQLLNDAQLKAIERMLENGMKTLTSYTQKEIHATTNAIEKLYDEQAKRLDMTKSEFLAGTKNYDIFSKNIEGANAYRNIEAQKDYLRNLANSGQNLTADQAAFLSQRNPYEQYRAWGVFKDDGELFNLINQYINQRASLQSQVYGQMGQAYRAINRVEGITNRRGGGGGGKDTTEKLVEGGISGMKIFDIESVKTTESMSALRAQLSAFQKALSEATNAADYRAAEQGIAHTKAQMGVQEIAVRMGLDTDSMLKLKDDIDKQMQTAIGDKIVPIKIETEPHAAAELEEDGKNVTEAWQGATSVIRSVGSALSSIENPAGKVVAIIAEAIANIAGGYAAAIGKEGAKSKNIYAFIASAAAAIVEMGVAISAVKQQTKFAEGGVVKGSTYSNDQIPALLNAGEVVLNRAQVGQLASVLSEDNAGTSSQPYVSGEQIYLGLNNYLRRTGRGEMITSR